MLYTLSLFPASVTLFFPVKSSISKTICCLQSGGVSFCRKMMSSTREKERRKKKKVGESSAKNMFANSVVAAGNAANILNISMIALLGKK